METLFLYNLVRPAGGVQEKVDIYVSTSIVISEAVDKEEWGLWVRSLVGVRTEIVNVER